MKKSKSLGINAALLLSSLLLFSQASQLELPYLVKEYLVLWIIKLYFATTYFIIPKFKQS